MARNKGIIFDNLMIIKGKTQAEEEGHKVNVSFLAKKDGQPAAGLPFIYLINGRPAEIDNPEDFKTNEHGFGSFDLTTELDEIRINVAHKDSDGKLWISRHTVKKLVEGKKEKTGKVAHATVLEPKISTKYAEALKKCAEVTAGTEGAWMIIDSFLLKLTDRQRNFFIHTIAGMNQDMVGRFLQRLIRMGEAERYRFVRANGLIPASDPIELYSSLLAKFAKKDSTAAQELMVFFKSLAPDLAESFMINIVNRRSAAALNLLEQLMADDDPKTLARNFGLFNPVK